MEKVHGRGWESVALLNNCSYKINVISNCAHNTKCFSRCSPPRAGYEEDLGGGWQLDRGAGEGKVGSYRVQGVTVVVDLCRLYCLP